MNPKVSYRRSMSLTLRASVKPVQLIGIGHKSARFPAICGAGVQRATAHSHPPRHNIRSAHHTGKITGDAALAHRPGRTDGLPVRAVTCTAGRRSRPHRRVEKEPRRATAKIQRSNAGKDKNCLNDPKNPSHLNPL